MRNGGNNNARLAAQGLKCHAKKLTGGGWASQWPVAI
jgi:hypothetical protein